MERYTKWHYDEQTGKEYWAVESNYGENKCGYTDISEAIYAGEAIDRLAEFETKYSWKEFDKVEPAEEGYYLCLTRGCDNYMFYNILEYSRRFDGETLEIPVFILWDIEFGDMNYSDRVVYWMPLPEKPEV